MIEIDDEKVISLNRGDKGEIDLSNIIDTSKIAKGDVINFRIYRQNGYSDEPIFSKDVTIDDSTKVIIPLEEEDTKVIPRIDKPKIYWYDVSVNETNTILGYDEEGAKQLIVYPALIGDEAKEERKIDTKENNTKDDKTKKVYGISKLFVRQARDLEMVQHMSMGNNQNICTPFWERTDDSIGLAARATLTGDKVTSDFDETDLFSKIKTCNYDIEQDKVTAWLGDDNFTFDGSNGQVMVYIPTTYWEIKKSEESNEVGMTLKRITKRVTLTPTAGWIKVPAFYISRYELYYDENTNKLVSKSGVEATLDTLDNFKNKLASSYSNIKVGLLDWREFVLENLFLIEYANGDYQQVMNEYANTSVNGDIFMVTDRNFSDYGIGVHQKNGECDNIGNQSGKNDKNILDCYRGIEGWKNNCPEFIDKTSIYYNRYLSFNGYYDCLGLAQTPTINVNGKEVPLRTISSSKEYTDSTVDGRFTSSYDINGNEQANTKMLINLLRVNEIGKYDEDNSDYYTDCPFIPTLGYNDSNNTDAVSKYAANDFTELLIPKEEASHFVQVTYDDRAKFSEKSKQFYYLKGGRSENVDTLYVYPQYEKGKHSGYNIDENNWIYFDSDGKTLNGLYYQLIAPTNIKAATRLIINTEE